MPHPDATIAAATQQHAAGLQRLCDDAAALLASNPCWCEGGICDHCTRLAWITVEAKQAYRDYVCHLVPAEKAA